MDQRREERPDQIVFRWEGNRGRTGTGITAVAYSCGRERAEELRAELAPLLRVEGSDRPSQVRYVREKTGEVVVINRRQDPDAHGRSSTESHALIGSRDLLKARFCLTLSRLPVPVPVVSLLETESRRLRRATLTELKDAADREWEQFTARVATAQLPLAAVAAQLLRTPDHLMSVRFPDFSDVGTNDTPLLIWGLCGIFGNWLGHDFWTYATYDTSDTHGLRVVGVPGWRTSAIEDARRERIELRSAPDDEAQQIAWELVRRFLAEPNEATQVRPVLDRCPGAATLPLPERLRTLNQLLRTTDSPSAERTGAAVVQPVRAAGPVPADSLAGSGAVVPQPDDGHRAGQEAPGADRLRTQSAAQPPVNVTDVPVHRPPSSHAPTVDRSSADERAGHDDFAGRHAPPEGASAPMTPPHAVFSDPKLSEPAPEAPPAAPSAPRPRPDSHHQEPRYRTPQSWTSRPQSADWERLPPVPQPISTGAARAHHPDHLTTESRPHEGDDRFPDRHPSPSAGPLRPLPPAPTKGRSLFRRLTFARWRHDRQATGGDSSRLSDQVLLRRLRDSALPRREVEHLLDALADRSPWRTSPEANLLCRAVLQDRLYLQHGRDAHHEGADEQAQWIAAETAVWLLHWAVLPYCGQQDVAGYMRRLFHHMRRQADSVERRFLELLVFARLYGVPDLPSRAWFELVRHLRDQPEVPSKETRDKPPGRTLDRPTGLKPAHRADPPPDDRWRFGFAVMSCVAVLLLLLLIA
ncbi:hypothetical protein ACFV16_02570 [Streptomyces massasporeus]|uniref:hypothetical protein n=1 Tax=Streptomyces massasporeus TaxID=67324 RepID=UPI00367AFDCC